MWKNKIAFTVTENSSRLVLDETTPVSKINDKYRVCNTVKAYKGTSSETFTVYSNEYLY